MPEEDKKNAPAAETTSDQASSSSKAKTKKLIADILWGVLQFVSGSHTLGEHTFTPLTPVPVPVEAKTLACTETTPVKFFETEEAALAHVKKLKERFDRKPITS